MPGYWVESLASRCARRRAAEARVRNKFPALMEGSSGWHQALAVQLRK